MLYKKLYKLDKNGTIRVWFMEQNKGSYRTHSGCLDGQIVTTDWTVCVEKNVGKSNATSVNDQAEQEILSQYKKKLKTGYKETIKSTAEIDKIKPMLAKKYNDYSRKINWSDGWICQCKFNGVRCIATKDGLFSRTGEKWITCDHISEELADLFKKYPDLVLDGELFNEGLRETLNDLIKLVRKTVHITDEDLKKSRQIVKYYVYDGFNLDGLPSVAAYHLRKETIDRNIAGLNNIKKVKSYNITSDADLEDRFQKFIDEKHEGIILRRLDSPYEFGRSKNLLKMKPEDDAEFTFLGVSEGVGNWAGKAKIIHLEDDNGNKFDATFKGSMAEATDFLKNYKYIVGKKVTIKYFGLTGLGTPNYAQFDINNQPYLGN